MALPIDALFTGSAGVSPAGLICCGRRSGRDARAPIFTKGLDLSFNWLPNRIRLIFVLLCGGCLLAAQAFAGGGRPAVLFGVPTIEADGFNRDALNGALTFQRLHGTPVDIMTNAPTPLGTPDGSQQIEQALANGAYPVVAVGFYFRTAIEAAARKHPNARFVLLDAAVEAPNVASVVFREEEAAFLVGALAALASRSGTIGFVGGLDMPLIRKFGCGYAHGAKHVTPGLRIVTAMNGTTAQAFTDEKRAHREATALINLGADVLFHAAGVAGLGVIEAARQRGVLAIGVDTNQNGIAPGTVLTSMLKRMDVAVYRALRDAGGDRWQAGTRELGLRENAVGWALDRHNILRVDAARHATLADLQFAIMEKSLTVFRYDEKSGCPYAEFPALQKAAP